MLTTSQLTSLSQQDLAQEVLERVLNSEKFRKAVLKEVTKVLQARSQKQSCRSESSCQEPCVQGVRQEYVEEQRPKVEADAPASCAVSTTSLSPLEFSDSYPKELIVQLMETQTAFETLPCFSKPVLDKIPQSRTAYEGFAQKLEALKHGHYFQSGNFQYLLYPSYSLKKITEVEFKATKPADQWSAVGSSRRPKTISEKSPIYFFLLKRCGPNRTVVARALNHCIFLQNVETCQSWLLFYDSDHCSMPRELSGSLKRNCNLISSGLHVVTGSSSLSKSIPSADVGSLSPSHHLLPQLQTSQSPAVLTRSAVSTASISSSPLPVLQGHSRSATSPLPPLKPVPSSSSVPSPILVHSSVPMQMPHQIHPVDPKERPVKRQRPMQRKEPGLSSTSVFEMELLAIEAGSPPTDNHLHRPQSSQFEEAVRMEAQSSWGSRFKRAADDIQLGFENHDDVVQTLVQLGEIKVRETSSN